MNKITASLSLALFAGLAFASAPSLSLSTPATTTAPAAATTPAYVSKTTSTISIAPRDNLIVATTITDWDPKASDTLTIHWVAPKGSYCSNSDFNLVRGPNSHHDVFWAYRTVVHTDGKGNTISCQGHWVARVVNSATGKILASAGYDVTAQVKPPLPGDTTVNNAAQNTDSSVSS